MNTYLELIQHIQERATELVPPDHEAPDRAKISNACYEQYVQIWHHHFDGLYALPSLLGFALAVIATIQGQIVYDAAVLRHAAWLNARNWREYGPTAQPIFSSFTRGPEGGGE